MTSLNSSVWSVSVSHGTIRVARKVPVWNQEPCVRVGNGRARLGENLKVDGNFPAELQGQYSLYCPGNGRPPLVTEFHAHWKQNGQIVFFTPAAEPGVNLRLGLPEGFNLDKVAFKSNRKPQRPEGQTETPPGFSECAILFLEHSDIIELVRKTVQAEAYAEANGGKEDQYAKAFGRMFLSCFDGEVRLLHERDHKKLLQDKGLAPVGEVASESEPVASTTEVPAAIPPANVRLAGKRRSKTRKPWRRQHTGKGRSEETTETPVGDGLEQTVDQLFDAIFNHESAKEAAASELPTVEGIVVDMTGYVPPKSVSEAVRATVDKHLNHPHNGGDPALAASMEQFMQEIEDGDDEPSGAQSVDVAGKEAAPVTVRALDKSGSMGGKPVQLTDNVLKGLFGGNVVVERK